MKMNFFLAATAVGSLMAFGSGTSAFAENEINENPACSGIARALKVTNHPTAIWGALQPKIASAIDKVATNNKGFKNNMWATIVNRDGFVCAVAFSGHKRNDQWPGSRIISEQKAYTANAFSLNHLALSTANLYPLVSPGGSLEGLLETNLLNAEVANAGSPYHYGTANDPLVGKKAAGLNSFGGGLPLYAGGMIVGGLGISGDTSCTDHSVAWELRKLLALNVTPNSDNIQYSTDPLVGHPTCFKTETPPV